MEAVCQDTIWPTCMVRMSKRPKNSFREITIPKMVLYMSAEVPEYLQKAEVVVSMLSMWYYISESRTQQSGSSSVVPWEHR